ncbi:MAG: hypothetical protein AB202_03920 [Parcubacteria bacterium C7867-007]|nr:MAG: hypothetical protein AB202_03920 [Parcubacteria bacterium C7867-007]
MSGVPNVCIIDGSTPESCDLNGMSGWRCPACLLMWRQSFDVPLSHYEDADASFSSEKAALQRRNIHDRINTIRRHIDCSYSCDVGCSKGYFVEALIEAGYTHVYGIDPNRAQIEAAQARGVPVLTGSTETMAPLFKERSTRTAMLFHVIEHLSDPFAVLKDIHAALPDKGLLVVETPDFQSYSLRKTNYHHKLVYPEHLFYYSFTNLQTFLRNNGFEIVYAGKRDFDPNHLPVRECLFRLGFLGISSTPSLFERIVCRVLRPVVPVLSVLVRVVGRQNFSIIIARKVS